MIPEKRKRTGDNLSNLHIDGTTALCGEQPIPGQTIEYGPALPRGYIPGNVRLKCPPPPYRGPWQRAIYDPARDDFFQFSELVRENRLPDIFLVRVGPGNIAAERLQRCNALNRCVPADLCSAACLALRKARGGTSCPERLGAVHMDLVAKEMPRLPYWTGAAFTEPMRSQAKQEAVEALLLLKRQDQSLAIGGQTVGSNEVGGLEIVSLETGVKRATIRGASKGKAPAVPRKSGSGAYQLAHYATSLATDQPAVGTNEVDDLETALSDDNETESDGEYDDIDTEYRPSSPMREIGASKRKAATTPQRRDSVLSSTGRHSRSVPRGTVTLSRTPSARDKTATAPLWTQEEDEMLYVLVRDTTPKWKWKKVEEVVGRSALACRLHFSTSGMDKQYQQGTASRLTSWTTADEQRVVTLRDHSKHTLAWGCIGADPTLSVSRSARACELQYKYVKHRLYAWPPVAVPPPPPQAVVSSSSPSSQNGAAPVGAAWQSAMFVQDDSS